MLAKIKSVVLYVLTPLAFIAGFIAYLMGDRDKWKAKFEQTRLNERMNNIVKEKEDAKINADSLDADYAAKLEQYKRDGGNVLGSPGGV